jgi:hypothetical protein
MNRDEDETGSAQGPRRVHVVGSISPFDPLPSVRAAVAVLSAAGAPFALIGGLALEAWGIPRATKDADFAVLVGSAEMAADRLGGENVETHPLRIGGVAVRDDARNLRIDFIDRRVHLAGLFRKTIEEASAAGRVTRVGELDVPLASLEHLLAMKMVSGEPKDDADVRRILRLEILDYGVARSIVEEHLGFATANRLDTMARDAGRPEVPPHKLYKNGDHTEDD